MITWIKEFYGSVIDLVGFIVGHTSDHGADIAIRALPILSPMPNAIGMYYVSITVLGFTHWQALAMALSMELGLFGLSEVALMMFDGLHTNERLYWWPFVISVLVAVGIMILIIIMVWSLETAHPILAVLPLFSAAGAMALALRRWHARNQAAQSAMHNELSIVQAKVISMHNESKTVQDDASRKLRAAQLKSEGLTNAQIGQELNVHRNTISAWLRQPLYTNGFKQEA